MSRTTHISRTAWAVVIAGALATVALNIALLVRGDTSDWPLALVLAAAAVGLALRQQRTTVDSQTSLCEIPLLIGLLVLSPGLAMAAGVLVGAVPRGRLGLVSRLSNMTTSALPIAAAGGAFIVARDLIGAQTPADGPIGWFVAATLAVAVDTVCHFALAGLWSRFAFGYPLRDWIRDVAVPLAKNDPLVGLLVVALVEIALLLPPEAKMLPAALAVVGYTGMWLSLRTTRYQIHARGLKDDFFRAIFVSLARILDMKDPDTAYHSARVAIISRDIARAMGLSDDEQSRIHLAGLLHDVGKVGVPDEILLKPGRLTDEERRIMERHARLSAEAIQGIPGFGDLVRMVYAHHERLDGSGYPEGIRGDDLPMGARILGVADTFEALTSDRPYRRGRSEVEALEVFEREAELFDGDVVASLRSLVLTGAMSERFSSMTEFSHEWSRAARHLEVRLDEEPFELPPERPAPSRSVELAGGTVVALPRREAAPVEAAAPAPPVAVP